MLGGSGSAPELGVEAARTVPGGSVPQALGAVGSLQLWVCVSVLTVSSTVTSLRTRTVFPSGFGSDWSLVARDTSAA